MQYNILRDDTATTTDSWGADQLTGYTPETADNYKASVRVKGIRSLILAYSPDLLLLNEREGNAAGGGWEGLEIVPAATYGVVEPTNSSITYNCNPIYYNKSKFTLLSADACGVMDTDEGDGNNMRALTWAILKETNGSGKVIAVFNTHLHAGSGTTLDLERQQAQATLIEAKICELLKTYTVDAVILGGDYNSTNASGTAYSSLLTLENADGIQLQDTLGLANVVDHIAVSDAEVLASERITIPVTGYVSDHKPIYTDIKLNSKED